MDAQSAIYDRMKNIAAHLGENGLDNLASQAGIMLVAVAGLFVVMTEVWLVTLKRQKDLNEEGQVTPFMIRFWSIFLLFPLYGLATRLLGLDLWYGAMGNPYPAVAGLATTNIQFPQNTAFVDETAIAEGFKIYMSGYAGQILLPALVACFLAWRIGLYGLTLSKIEEHKNTGQIFLMVAGLLGVLFLPNALDANLWKAFWGNPSELTEQLFSYLTQGVNP